MAKFEVDFQVKGIGEVQLPVTILDEILLLVNGLEAKVFRFSFQNILTVPITIGLSSVQTGTGSSKVGITFDFNSITVAPGESATVSTTITPTESLIEGDLIDIKVLGQSV